MNNPELRIQHDCFLLLQKCGIMAHSVPNEAGGRSRIEQTQLVSAGLVSGVADMIVWWPHHSLIERGFIPTHKQQSYPVTIGYVEFKTATGRQSDRQKAFQELCATHGVEYALVRSIQDMEELIRLHLH